MNNHDLRMLDQIGAMVIVLLLAAPAVALVIKLICGVLL